MEVDDLQQTSDDLGFPAAEAPWNGTLPTGGFVLDQLWARGVEQSGTGLILAGLEDHDFGRLLALNPAAAELLGHPGARLIASDLSSRMERLGVAEGDGEQIRRSLRRISTGETEISRATVEITDAAGERRWIEATFTGVRVASERPQAALVRLEDVSADHVRAQGQEAIHSVAQVLARAMTVEGALAALPAALGGAFEAAFAAVWSLERSTGLLRACSTWDDDTEAARRLAGHTSETSITPGSELPGTAYLTGRPAVHRDLAEDSLTPRAASASAAGLCGALIVPICVDGKAVAVVELLFARRLERTPALAEAAEELSGALTSLIEPIWVDERRQPARELLLVEDNEFVARLVREMLHSAYEDPGLRLVHVDSLGGAREHLATKRPQCVVLDLTLPDADGLDALLEIRRRAPEVPIVVLTGEEDEVLAEQAVREGAQDYLMKRKIDLQGLARSIRYAIRRKGHEQRLLANRLRHPLTGLPTRLLFLDSVRVGLSRARPDGVAVVIVNVDRFRIVNNSLGHERADQLLLELAGRIQEVAGPDCTAAALEGDSFAVLVESPEAELAAVALARRLRERVSTPFTLGGEQLVLTATIGIAVGDSGTPSAENLVGDAETAVGLGKEHGGDGLEIFAESARCELRARLRLESALRAAVGREELRLHYQPLVSLADGQIVAFEALVRWEHPERGLLAPGEFMALAEESGLDVPLGRWVLREACRQLRVWREVHDPGVRVNVNLSAAQVQDPALLDDLRAILAEEGVPAEALTLEVTETSLMQNLSQSAGVLAELRALGFQLALDDFGTGYSSLSYVSQLPIDVIKLDRSFVKNLGHERESAIVALVGTLARAIGLPAVAEGVEDPTDIERLRGLGYELAQGYWFSCPVPPDQAVTLLGCLLNGPVG